MYVEYLIRAFYLISYSQNHIKEDIKQVPWLITKLGLKSILPLVQK